jgi:hypothetical protein
LWNFHQKEEKFHISIPESITDFEKIQNYLKELIHSRGPEFERQFKEGSARLKCIVFETAYYQLLHLMTHTQGDSKAAKQSLAEYLKFFIDTFACDSESIFNERAKLLVFMAMAHYDTARVVRAYMSKELLEKRGKLDVLRYFYHHLKQVDEDYKELKLAKYEDELIKNVYAILDKCASKNPDKKLSKEDIQNLMSDPSLREFISHVLCLMLRNFPTMRFALGQNIIDELRSNSESYTKKKTFRDFVEKCGVEREDLQIA